ncbi:T9SS type A sorting domain-containing protein [bacterium SCSIO 12741]|nr:T9SS type A sorting domain-containing protein [bacterium SCSIO 12741]
MNNRKLLGILLGLLAPFVTLAQGSLTFNGNSGFIFFACGNTPNTPTIDLDYTITVGDPQNCGCSVHRDLRFRLVDGNGDEVDQQFSPALTTSANITYNLTFTVPNAPESYTVQLWEGETGWNGMNCDVACAENNHLSNSNTVTLVHPNATNLNLNYTGATYAFSNGIHQICSGSPKTVSTNGCETQFRPLIERLDANGNSFSTPDYVAQGNFTFATTDGFDFNSMGYTFLNNTNYRLILHTFFPMATHSIKIHNTNTQTISTSNYSVCTGNNITMTATGASNLVWNPSTYLSGGNTGSSVTAVNPSNSIQYTVSSTDNCVVPATALLTVNQTPTIDVSSNPTDVCDNATPLQLQAAAVPTGGTGVWTGSSCAVTSAGVFDPIGNGCNVSGWSYSYGFSSMTYTYTTAQGCQASESFSLTYHKPSDLDLTTVNACFNSATGSASIAPTGNGPFSIPSWNVPAGSSPVYSNASKDVEGLATGSGTVSVVDDDGCTNSESFTIGEHGKVIVNATVVADALCSPSSWSNQYGEADITFSGGAGAPYYMSIDGGSAFGPVSSTYTINPTGEPHSVTIEDVQGCQGTVNFTVNSQNDLDFASGYPQSTDATCVGLNNGSIDIQLTGGTPNYTYKWNPGSGNVTQSSNQYTISGLATSPHDYWVTVTDQNGSCTIIAGPYNIGETNPALWDVDFTGITPPTCNGIPDGEITGTFNGVNMSPYTYNWGSGQNTATLSDLPDGNYSLTMTDFMGCKETGVYSLVSAGPEDWQKVTGGNNGPIKDEPVAMAIDASGNVYMAGNFKGQTMFDGQPIVAGANANGDQGIFIVKYDECGIMQWVVNSDFDQVPQDFEVADITLLGNHVFLLGKQQGLGSFRFAGVPASNVSTTNRWFMLKVNQNTGVMTNNRGLNSNLSGADQIYDMEVHCSNNRFYLAGRDGGTNAATVYRVNFGNGNVFTLLQDQAGTPNSEFRDIEFDDANGVLYAVGTMYADAEFSGNAINTMYLTSSSDAFVVRGTMTGCANWTYTHQTHSGITGDLATGLSLEWDDDQMLYITGNYQGILSNWNNLSTGMNNAYILKLKEADLGFKWSSDVNETMGIQWANSNDLSIDEDGNIMVVGTFQGDNIEITSGSFQDDSPGNNSTTALWLASFDPNQDLNWTLSAKCTSGSDPASGVALVSGSSSSYASGIFQHNLELEMVAGSLTHHNAGTFTDAGFVLRFGEAYTGITGQFYKKGDDLSSSEIQDVNEELSIYPNPSSGQINIQWPESLSGETVTLSMTDVSGKIVEQWVRVAQGSQLETLSIDNLEAGTYFLEMRLEERSWRSTVIKY